MSETKSPLLVTAGGGVNAGAASVFVRHHDTTVSAEGQGPGGAVHAGGRVVGEVRQGVFHKDVCASRHMLRNPKGWALDLTSIEEAENLGASWVAIHDLESHKTYTASIEHIREYGFRLERGFGRQIALVLERWSTTDGHKAAVQGALL